MPCDCPECGTPSLVSQDIETLSDSVLLVKLEKRIQLRCKACGWMDFEDPPILNSDLSAKDVSLNAPG